MAPRACSPLWGLSGAIPRIHARKKSKQDGIKRARPTIQRYRKRRHSDDLTLEKRLPLPTSPARYPATGRAEAPAPGPWYVPLSTLGALALLGSSGRARPVGSHPTGYRAVTRPLSLPLQAGPALLTLAHDAALPSLTVTMHRYKVAAQQCSVKGYYLRA
jgi:hypothetical protein